MLFATADTPFRCVSIGERDSAPAMLGHWPFAGRDAEHVRIDLSRTDRRSVLAAQIDAAVARADRAVLVIAEGMSCAAVAWWAKLSPARYVLPVAGALLIAPRSSSRTADMFAAPDGHLPFPSVVLGDDDASQYHAYGWGSRMVDGPLPISGGSPSRRLRGMMARFTAAIVQADARTAARMIEAIGDRG